MTERNVVLMVWGKEENQGVEVIVGWKEGARRRKTGGACFRPARRMYFAFLLSSASQPMVASCFNAFLTWASQSGLVPIAGKFNLLPSAQSQTNAIDAAHHILSTFKAASNSDGRSP